MRHLALVAVGALGERLRRQMIVGAAFGCARLRVAPFWIWHENLTNLGLLESSDRTGVQARVPAIKNLFRVGFGRRHPSRRAEARLKPNFAGQMRT